MKFNLISLFELIKLRLWHIIYGTEHSSNIKCHMVTELWIKGPLCHSDPKTNRNLKENHNKNWEYGSK